MQKFDLIAFLYAGKFVTQVILFQKMIVKYSDGDNPELAKQIILEAGQNFYVPIGLRHQMYALEDSHLFEFSTQHFDSDSHRIRRGD